MAFNHAEIFYGTRANISDTLENDENHDEKRIK
jgi:hypothetical protein